MNDSDASDDSSGISVFDREGNILFLSIEKLIERVVRDQCCFICCEPRSSKKFNSEHVIPDWVLSLCDLYEDEITFPNGQRMSYSKYKIPCCTECNRKLSDVFESPVSNLFKLSYEDFCAALHDENTRLLLYQWLCLIYIKTHLKDTQVRFHPDKRMEEGMIADKYDWGFMHHLHCVARAHYTNVSIDPKVIGSMFVLPALPMLAGKPYDFLDVIGCNTMLIRINSIVVFAVLDDACGCYSADPYFITKWIRGPLAPIQAREICARLAHMNASLKVRPNFSTNFSSWPPTINVTHPDAPEFVDIGHELLGKFMTDFCGSDLEMIKFSDASTEEVEERLKQGIATFIINGEGEFIDFSKAITIPDQLETEVDATSQEPNT